MTNDLEIAQVLKNSNAKVYICGGMLQKETGSLFGRYATEMLKDFRFDVGFFGAASINEDFQVTTPTHAKNVAETAGAKAMRKILSGSRSVEIWQTIHDLDQPAGRLHRCNYGPAVHTGGNRSIRDAGSKDYWDLIQEGMTTRTCIKSRKPFLFRFRRWEILKRQNYAKNGSSKFATRHSAQTGKFRKPNA